MQQGSGVEIRSKENRGMPSLTGGGIILKLTLNEEGWKSVDWINLAQTKDKCQAVVNTVMNFRVPSSAEDLLTV